MNARTFLLATVSSLAMIGAASAADMPLKAALPPPPPVANWTGWYIGIDGGAGRHNFAITENDEGGSVAGSKTGFVAGGHIGYNWQTHYYLFGLEADGMWTDLRRTFGSGTTFGPAVTGGPSTTLSEVNWLASVRTRQGIALEDTLIYVTGGVAFAGVKNGWADGYSAVALVPAGTCCDIQSNQTKVGWVAGFGLEHMWTRNLSIRSEVLYYDLGRTEASGNSAPAAPGVPASLRLNATNEVFVSRLGLSLKW